ncbi:MAG: hypothetical protein HY801_12850 [Candidatus Lindowbacteria bacterium]|nr:hypothetical protein [Candidatus Lindowbacteria bacterium]
MKKTFDAKKFLRLWKKHKEEEEKEEWLFAVAVVRAGLEYEGNYDLAAQEEIASALKQLHISPGELQQYLDENRSRLLRFLDSPPMLNLSDDSTHP